MDSAYIFSLRYYCNKFSGRPGLTDVPARADAQVSGEKEKCAIYCFILFLLSFTVYVDILLWFTVFFKEYYLYLSAKILQKGFKKMNAAQSRLYTALPGMYFLIEADDNSVVLNKILFERPAAEM